MPPSRPGATRLLSLTRRGKPVATATRSKPPSAQQPLALATKLSPRCIARLGLNFLWQYDLPGYLQGFAWLFTGLCLAVYQAASTASVAMRIMLSGAKPRASTKPTRHMPAMRAPACGTMACASSAAGSVYTARTTCK